MPLAPFCLARGHALTETLKKGRNNVKKINAPTFLAGFALGAAIGSAFALLLAPARGEETQQRLREQAPELGGRGKEAAQRALAQSREAATRTWTGVTSKAEELKARLRREEPSGQSSDQEIAQAGGGEPS